MERHEHLGAVAAALRAVPRSLPWDGGLEPLERLERPHAGGRLPRRRRSAAPAGDGRGVRAGCLPHAELVVEDEGKAPLAWQGGRLSEAIAEFLAESG